MFTVTMLPARVGDAIWIEYGLPNAPHRVLIDAGTPPTATHVLRDRIAPLGDHAFELMIVTHIDTDHIGGAVPLLRTIATPMTFDQVWFNGWRHLAPDTLDILGPIDGEKLTAEIIRLGIPWNSAFPRGDDAARTSPAGAKLPCVSLPGGMALTILSPRRAELDKLRPVWEPVIQAAGLLGGDGTGIADPEPVDAPDLLGGDPLEDWAAHDPSDLDDTESNGSSIAVLAEYKDGDVVKRCLLCGDGHGPVLVEGITRLAKERGEDRLRVDAFKLPHHGSVRNVTRELIEAVDTDRYMVSTNGGGTYGHPHHGALARAILYKARPVSVKFNYPGTDKSGVWDDAIWKNKHDYETEYGDGTLTVAL